MKGRCDRLWEIDAYREGSLAATDAAFERHLRECVECRTQLDRDRDLGGRVRRLLDPAPDELGLRRVRRRVLRDAALGAPLRTTLPRVGWALAGVAVAAAGLAMFRSVTMTPAPRGEVAAKALVSSAPSPPDAPPRGSEAFAGAVKPSPGARWWQTRDDSTERVRLDDGSIRVHVRPQAPGERFLVALPDGEIEVRGTTFDVSVERGATTRIHVDDGVVELRIAGQGTTRIGAGESAAPAPSLRASNVRVLPRLSRPAAAPEDVSPRAAATATHPAGVDYAAAIRLLRDGHADQAATAFHALASVPDVAQGEDASFLEALALSRAGRADAAGLVSERHLAAFPDSFHRKEAIILILRAASQRGDCAKAQETLDSWNGDPSDPSIRRAFGSCGDPPR